MAVGSRANVGHPAGDGLPHVLEAGIGGEGLGHLVVVRLETHVGADSLLGSGPAVDLVASVAAVLPDEVIALDELWRWWLGELLARLEIDHLVVALQAARLLEPLRQHRLDPVVVVEPAMLIMPLVGLFGRVGRVRRPLEARGAPLPLMADRAAEVLHGMRARIAHEEVEPRVARIRLRDAAAHREREGLAPGGRVEKRRDGHLASQRLAAVHRLDHVAGLEARDRRRRLGHHHADGRIIGSKQPVGREPQTVGGFEPVVPVAGRHLRLRRRRRERHRHGGRLGIPGLSRRSSHRLVHPAVAGRATVEAGDVSEVVVEGKLRQPDLIDPDRAVEGFEHREFEQTFPSIRLPHGERLLELHKLGAMVGQGLGRIILALGHLPQQSVEFLTVSVGILKRQARGSHLLTLGVGEHEQ